MRWFLTGGLAALSVWAIAVDHHDWWMIVAWGVWFVTWVVVVARDEVLHG